MVRSFGTETRCTNNDLGIDRGIEHSNEPRKRTEKTTNHIFINFRNQKSGKYDFCSYSFW